MKKKSKSKTRDVQRVLDSNPADWSKEDIVNVLLLTILKDRPQVLVEESYDDKGNKISAKYCFATILNKFNI